MKKIIFRIAFLLIVSVSTVGKMHGQTAMPDIFMKGTLTEQMNYLQEHTLIYENYRAIREDMFQKIKTNTSDSIHSFKTTIDGLKRKSLSQNHVIDSLTTSLGATSSNLDEMTRTKESIRVMGMVISKAAYNRTMWTIVIILIGLLALGFVIFKRNLSLLTGAKNDLRDLKNEFETYRKTAREAREKMTMDHFKELKKLRGE